MKIRLSRVGDQVVWRAIPHSPNNPNVASLDPKRSRLGKIGAEEVDFYLGDPPYVDRNGNPRSGTRVNFKFRGEWFHITKGDQHDVNGTKPNLYPIVERAIRQKETSTALEFKVVNGNN